MTTRHRVKDETQGFTTEEERPEYIITQNEWNTLYNMDQNDFVIDLLERVRSRMILKQEPTYTDLVTFARWTQKFWREGQEIQRKHGIVIDNLDDPMQKLAFTYYTNLSEIDLCASQLFGEGYGDENYGKEHEIYTPEHDQRIRESVMDEFGILHGEDAKRFHELLENPEPLNERTTEMVKRAQEIASKLEIDTFGPFIVEHDAQVAAKVLDEAIKIVSDGLNNLPEFTIPEVRQGKIDACEWVIEKLEQLRQREQP
jgi:hypothetical protein